MSEQDCAGRKALKIAEEFIAAELAVRNASFLPEPTEHELGCLQEAEYALAVVRMALSSHCEHAVEVERLRRDDRQVDVPMAAAGEDSTVPDLYRLAFIPGAFRCPKCGFALTKTTLSVATGQAGTVEADRESEPCPNDGTMMVHVTYREALEEYSDRLREEMDERDQLRAELEKAQALNHRWNRAASQHGPCGSEFHDDPERVFARVLEARQFASEVARVKAEKRANTELDTLKAETVRVLEPFVEHFSRMAKDGDYSYMQERIKDWFGVSDFRAAHALHARLTQEQNPEEQNG